MNMKTKWIFVLASTCALNPLVAVLASDLPSFSFDGTQSAFKFDFNDTESHLLYGTEEYEDTCYSHEAVGSHEECTDNLLMGSLNKSGNKDCSDSPEQVCRTDSSGQESCTSITARRCDPPSGGGGGSSSDDDGPSYTPSTPTRSCTTVTDYEDVPYSCTQTRTVVTGSELDYRDHFTTTVQFLSVPTGIKVSDRFKLSGTEDGARLEFTGSSTLAYRVSSDDKVVVVQPDAGPDSPGVKEIRTDIKVQPLILKAALEPYAQKITDIKIEKGILSFVVGQITYPEILTTSVEIDQHRKIFGYKKAFSGKVESAKRVIENIDVGGQTRSRISIALADLGLSALEGKLKINVQMGYSDPAGAAILNDSSLTAQDPIQATTKIKYSIQ